MSAPSSVDRALAELELRRRAEEAADQRGPGFLEYCRQTSPASWSYDVPHLRLIAEHLEAVRRGEIDRLAIHMPPRHAKTETATIRGASWLFEQHPSDNVLITAAIDRLARRFSRKARNIVAARQPLAPDMAAADEWGTLSGGTFMSRGVGSPPTGIGFRYIFVDDPIRRRQDAESEVFREAAWDWYSDDLYTRLEPGGAIVLTATRWHPGDVAARAVASEPGRWVVLNLAAIAEEGDPLGRKVGEPLWPERYDRAALERIKSVLTRKHGEYSWRALYQQQPTPQAGAFFNQTKIRVGPGPSPAEIVRSARAWDLAATADGGNWTAGPRLDLDTTGRIWIRDVKRERLAVDERDALILQTAALDGHAVPIRLPQDPGQAGKAEAQRLLRLLMGYPVQILPVSGPKTTRAAGMAAQVNGGNVWIVEGCPNADALLEELRTFPGGATDDIVDGLSDALTLLTGSVVADEDSIA